MISRTWSKRILLFLILLPLTFLSFSQEKLQHDSLYIANSQAMFESLYEQGVSMTEDSLFISEEALKVLKDSTYRAEIYPSVYTWQSAYGLIQKQELKRAFWFFINLYPESDQNKELVMQSIIAYDKALNMEKVLVATFYTYCFMDPEIGNIIDQKPEIHSPHILEEKLSSLSTILGFLETYRRAHPDNIDKSKP